MLNISSSIIMSRTNRNLPQNSTLLHLQRSVLSPFLEHEVSVSWADNYSIPLSSTDDFNFILCNFFTPRVLFSDFISISGRLHFLKILLLLHFVQISIVALWPQISMSWSKIGKKLQCTVTGFVTAISNGVRGIKKCVSVR